jgi:predicted extracellular nuclease
MRPRRTALLTAIVLLLVGLLAAAPAAAATDSRGALADDGDPRVVCDAADLTLISAVQGTGSASPLAGQRVTVEGAITAIYPELGGITVQEEPTDVDNDPASSEGVFVFLGFGFDEAAFERFAIVQVTGQVQERFDNTQISGDAIVCDADPVEIAPTPLTLPADDVTRESLEGTLVVTTQDLTVTGLFTAYEFGELGVAPGGILREPSNEYEPGSAEALALVEHNEQSLLYIDDRGEFEPDANAPWFGEPGERAGDLVEAGVEGVLYYSFGDHLLDPVGDFPEIVDGDAAFSDRRPAPDLTGGTDLGAFNVLNYFNTFGASEVLRGARSQEQFELQTAKIVDVIVELDSAVLGLIELENDYEDLHDGDEATQPAIQDLVDALNAEAGAGTYDRIHVPESLLTTEGLGGGGLGTDAIAVGIVYQPALATPLGGPATFDIDALLTGEDPDVNRWPLAQSFEIDGTVITVVVNHLKSKGSSCDGVVVPAGFGDGQDDPQTGSCDLVREYAAERLIEWIETKPTGVNSPDTFVVGDLNAYAEEDPIRIFEDAGYLDLVQRYGDDEFTYKFDGRFGRLDYVLASPSARRLVDDAAVWHANAPEPYGYLYFNEPIDDTAYASSDHDPVVAAISRPGRGHGRQ